MTRHARTLLLATRSPDKVREITHILAPVFAGSVISLREAGIEPSAEEELVEAFDSFLDNAHAKAAFFLRRSGLPTLADDSGICVDALDGAPGVRSRRFAANPATAHSTPDGAGSTGTPRPGGAPAPAPAPVTSGSDVDLANNQRLLHLLSGVPENLRTARYTCAAVLHLPPPWSTSCSAVGTCSGLILQQPRGDGGFGYDPIFLDPASGRTFAELDAAEKNHRSHRARAFRSLAASFPHLPHGPVST